MFTPFLFPGSRTLRRGGLLVSSTLRWMIAEYRYAGCKAFRHATRDRRGKNRGGLIIRQDEGARNVFESPGEPSSAADCILSIRERAGGRRAPRRERDGCLAKIERGREWNQEAGRGGRGGGERRGNTVEDWAWKRRPVPRQRLKVKLRSTAAREFGFPLVTEYSQSYPTLPTAFAALTLKYDLILPLRTSSRRGKRFRDVQPLSGCPCGCLPRGCQTFRRRHTGATVAGPHVRAPFLETLRKIAGFRLRKIRGYNAIVRPGPGER